MTGCAAGQVAETAEELPAVNGAMAHTGKVVVSNGTLAYPETTQGVYAKGSDIKLAVTLVNSGSADDELVGVSSTAASDVLLEGSTTIPSDGKLIVGGSEDADDAAESADGAQVDDDGDAVADGEAAKDENSGARIVLRDTTLPVRSGQSLPVTFTFADAGKVTTEFPIANPDSDASIADRGNEAAEAAQSDQDESRSEQD